MSGYEQPAKTQYHVTLREFDWVNAKEGDDPHYWTVADITMGGRSILDDLRKMHPGYGSQYVSFDTVFGHIGWQRSRAHALAYADSVIDYHRQHYAVRTA